MAARKFEEMVDIKELATLLKISEDFIESSRTSRGLPFYVLSPRIYRYRLSEVEKWLKERKKNG